MPRLLGITLAVMRLFGNFVAVNLAVMPRLLGITLAVMRLYGNFVAVIMRLRRG